MMILDNDPVHLRQERGGATKRHEGQQGKIEKELNDDHFRPKRQ